MKSSVHPDSPVDGYKGDGHSRAALMQRKIVLQHGYLEIQFYTFLLFHLNSSIHQKRANSPYGQLLERFPIFSLSFALHHSLSCGLIRSSFCWQEVWGDLLLIIILQSLALSFLVDRHQTIHINASPALHIWSYEYMSLLKTGRQLTEEQKLGSSPLKMRLEDPCQSWGRPLGLCRGGWFLFSPQPTLSGTQCRSAAAPKQLSWCHFSLG